MGRPEPPSPRHSKVFRTGCAPSFRRLLPGFSIFGSEAIATGAGVEDLGTMSNQTRPPGAPQSLVFTGARAASALIPILRLLEKEVSLLEGFSLQGAGDS